MKYVAIEGSSYVGKTTVVNRLSQEGFDIIPEYDAFGPFPPLGKTLDACKEAAMDFIHRERLRSLMLGRLASNELVFSDRSLFSLITYEDMMMHAAKTDAVREQHRNVQDYIIDILDKEIRQGDIVPPDASIILRIDSKDNFESRVKQRGVTAIRYLSYFTVQQLIAERAFTYSVTVLGNDASDTIDVSSNTENEVFNRVSTIAMAILPSKEPKDITKIRKVVDENTTAITRST